MELSEGLLLLPEVVLYRGLILVNDVL